MPVKNLPRCPCIARCIAETHFEARWPLDRRPSNSAMHRCRSKKQSECVSVMVPTCNGRTRRVAVAAAVCALSFVFTAHCVSTRGCSPPCRDEATFISVTVVSPQSLYGNGFALIMAHAWRTQVASVTGRARRIAAFR